jgi:hypothetical protein
MLLLEASTSAPLGSPPWRLATRDSIGVVGSYPPPRPVNASSPPPPQDPSRTSPKQGSARSPSMQPWLPLPLRKGSDHAVRGSQVLLSAPPEGPSVLSDLLPRSRTSSSTIGILSPLVDEGFPSQRPVVGPLAARVMPGSGTSERLSPLFGAVRFLGLLGRLRQGFPWRSPSSVIRLFESPKGSSFVPAGRLSASDLTQSAPSDQDRVFSVFFASRRRTSGTSTFSGSHGRTPSAATLQSGSSRKRLLLGAHHVVPLARTHAGACPPSLGFFTCFAASQLAACGRLSLPHGKGVSSRRDTRPHEALAPCPGSPPPPRSSSISSRTWPLRSRGTPSSPRGRYTAGSIGPHGTVQRQVASSSGPFRDRPQGSFSPLRCLAAPVGTTARAPSRASSPSSSTSASAKVAPSPSRKKGQRPFHLPRRVACEGLAPDDGFRLHRSEERLPRFPSRGSTP